MTASKPMDYCEHRFECRDCGAVHADIPKVPSDPKYKIRESEYDALVAERDRYRSALHDIANHKQDSIDKVYLIHQCEGYQKRARMALGGGDSGTKVE